MESMNLPILKGILIGEVQYHNAPVRFGRVPKREKAKILAAMQQSSVARSAEKLVAAELEDAQRVASSVVRAHLETCDFTRDKVEPLLQRARDHPSYTACPQSLACPLNPSPAPLNGQQEALQDFSKRFSPAIRGVVEFAKRIPGFSLLPQDDQVTLLKAGVFEVLLVRLACMFDSQTNCMICLNGQVLRRDALHNSANARFLMDSMFDFAERMNGLRLSDAEIGLFCAVVVIAADRPGLRNTELIERMASTLRGALQAVLAQNHPAQPAICQELMKKIPDLRTLNTLHSEKLLAFKMTEQQQQQMYGSTEDSSLGSPASYGMDESVKSPMGSVSSSESVCSSEVAALSELQSAQRPPLGSILAAHLHVPPLMHCPVKRRRDNSQSESGDECSSLGGDSSASSSPPGTTSTCPRGYKARKLDSPSDSGIESGTEKMDKHPASAPTSVCSSPRSSLPDEKSEGSSSIVDDMPVLKRALQAPPLYDTNSLMDEAYKPHKKFRAHRKNSGDAEVVSSYSSSPSPNECSVSMSSHLAAALSSPLSSSLASSLSSTHSTLARSLMEGPKMTAEQLKRTDIIHSFIMQETESAGQNGFTTSQQQYQQNQQTVSKSASGNLLVCAPNYYIPAQRNPSVVEQTLPTTSWNSSYQQQVSHSFAQPPTTGQQNHLTHVSLSSSGTPTATVTSQQVDISQLYSRLYYDASPSSANQSGVSPSSPTNTVRSISPVSPPKVVELQVDIADSAQPLNLSKKTPPPPKISWEV